MAPPRETDWTAIGYSTQLLIESPESHQTKPEPWGIRLLTVTGRCVELWNFTDHSATPKLDHFYTWQLLHDLPAGFDTDAETVIIQQSVRLIEVKRDLEAFRAALPTGLASVYLPCTHERYESTGFTTDDDDSYVILIDHRVCLDCHEAHTHRYSYDAPLPRAYLVYMLGLARDWAHGFIRIAELAISQYDQLERFKDKPGDKAPAQVERIDVDDALSYARIEFLDGELDRIADTLRAMDQANEYWVSSTAIGVPTSWGRSSPATPTTSPRTMGPRVMLALIENLASERIKNQRYRDLVKVVMVDILHRARFEWVGVIPVESPGLVQRAVLANRNYLAEEISPLADRINVTLPIDLAEEMAYEWNQQKAGWAEIMEKRP